MLFNNHQQSKTMQTTIKIQVNYGKLEDILYVISSILVKQWYSNYHTEFLWEIKHIITKNVIFNFLENGRRKACNDIRQLKTPDTAIRREAHINLAQKPQNISCKKSNWIAAVLRRIGCHSLSRSLDSAIGGRILPQQSNNQLRTTQKAARAYILYN